MLAKSTLEPYRPLYLQLGIKQIREFDTGNATRAVLSLPPLYKRITTACMRLSRFPKGCCSAIGFIDEVYVTVRYINLGREVDHLISGLTS